MYHPPRPIFIFLLDWKMCRTAGSSKIWNQRGVRGEGSDLTPLRIGPRYRVRKNITFSCNLASCRDIQKIHLFLFSKLAEVWLNDGQGMDDQEEIMKNMN